MNIIDMLDNSDNLTTIERNISAYILENRYDFAHLTITDLARLTYTSNAAIIRLCKKMDTKGFKDFKIRFVQDLEKKNFEISKVNMNIPLSKHKPNQDVMHTISLLSKTTIDLCYSSIQFNTIKKATEILTRSNRIYVYGSGDSLLSGMLFVNRLLKIGIQAIIANQYNETAKYLNILNKNDVVVCISYSGNNVIEKEYLEFIKKKGCSRILISSKPQDPLFDVVIPIPAQESYDSNLKTTTFYSQIAINYVLNCIFSLMDNESSNRVNHLEF